MRRSEMGMLDLNIGINAPIFGRFWQSKLGLRTHRTNARFRFCRQNVVQHYLGVLDRRVHDRSSAGETLLHDDRQRRIGKFVY